MPRFCLILMLAAAAALVAAGCDRKPSKPQGQGPAQQQRNAAPKDSWSAQEIARDPQGYLEWSNNRVAQQISDREKQLAALATRRGDWEKRRDGFETNLTDWQNIRRRLGEAYQRADDEDRWPLHFADRALSRDKAQAAMDAIDKRLAEYTPDRQLYQDVLAKMDQAADAYRNDIHQLARLRQKMEADLEQVRLTQDLAKVQELRKSEAQLDSMAKAAVSVSDDSGGLPAPKTPAARVNLDDILKP